MKIYNNLQGQRRIRFNVNINLILTSANRLLRTQKEQLKPVSEFDNRFTVKIFLEQTVR